MGKGPLTATSPLTSLTKALPIVLQLCLALYFENLVSVLMEGREGHQVLLVRLSHGHCGGRLDI